MSSAPKQNVFNLSIDGAGTINNVAFDVKGRGNGNTTTGQFSFEVDFSAVAPDTDPFANVLGVLILPTGAFGREIDDADGLMKLAGGVFEFAQMIAGEGIQVRSTGNISRVNSGELAWTSQAKGLVKLKQVSAIEPFQVVMLPQGAGKIIEVISLPLIEQGKRITLQSVRHFTFTPGSELRQLQLRHTIVDHSVETSRVRVNTKSTIQPFFRDVKYPC